MPLRFIHVVGCISSYSFLLLRVINLPCLLRSFLGLALKVLHLGKLPGKLGQLNILISRICLYEFVYPYFSEFTASVKILVQIFCGCMLSLFLDKYLRVELLVSYGKYKFSCLKKLPDLFPKWMYNFILPTTYEFHLLHSILISAVPVEVQRYFILNLSFPDY